jgi:hypothetical protein
MVLSKEDAEFIRKTGVYNQNYGYRVRYIRKQRIPSSYWPHLMNYKRFMALGEQLLRNEGWF